MSPAILVGMLGMLGAGAAFAQAPATPDIAAGARAESVAPLVEGEVGRAEGALLRGLDKVSGQSTDLVLNVGESVNFGRLEVRLGECRYPADDPESDAFAQLTITNSHSREALFTGWMIASSPAMSALDDARYDVWVVSCNDGAGSMRPDVSYEPDTAEPEGGEGIGPDGEAAPMEDDAEDEAG